MTKPQVLSPLVGSDRYYFPDGRPLEFSAGKDYQVFDQHGQAYIDFVCGLGPVILGHANARFNAELSLALSKGLSFPGFGLAHRRVAESLEAQHPPLRVISLFKTSSEAVTAALRCAMIKTKRKQILRCGFLGWHDAEIYSTPSWHEPLHSSKRKALRFIEGFRGVSGAESVHNWEDLDLTSLSSLLSQYGRELAAFAVDSYQLAFMPDWVLAAAVKLCREYGLQIIYDETKTAGRTCAGGYLRDFTLQPDYFILGKAIANGLPLAVLLGDGAELENYQKARLGGTHSKEVLSATACQITMDLMTELDGYKRIPQLGKNICAAFNAAAQAAKVQTLVRAQELFDGALFDLRYSDQLVNETEQRAKLKASFFKHRLLLLDGHCSFVSLAHEELDLDFLADLFYKSLCAWVSS